MQQLFIDVEAHELKDRQENFGYKSGGIGRRDSAKDLPPEAQYEVKVKTEKILVTR